MHIVSPNQPNLFPRLAMLERAAVADHYVVLMSAQFRRQSDQASIAIVEQGKLVELRWPVESGRKSFGYTSYQIDDRFERKFMARLQGAYGKMDGWKVGSEAVRQMLDEARCGAAMGAIGEWSLGWLAAALGCDAVTQPDDKVMPSIAGDPSGWMMRLCARSAENIGLPGQEAVYYCGKAGQDAYLNKREWAQHGIRYLQQDYVVPAVDGLPAGLNVSGLDIVMRGQKAIDVVRRDFDEARARCERRYDELVADWRQHDERRTAA